jgi:hypothetical protein
MSKLYRGRPSIDASYQVLVHLAKLFQRRRSSSSRYGVNSSTSRLKLQRMVGEQQKIARVCTIKMSLFTVKSSWYCSHVSDESRHSDGIFCMWCLNDSTVGWLRNSGGRKFQDTMVLGRNEYLYASTLVLIWWMQGNDHLTWRGGYGFFLNKYSDSQCCWKKYSDFGGGKKNNMIQSFCHIT